ncbi:MAG: serine/threonine-protein kinase [Pseudomonadota bacterium]
MAVGFDLHKRLGQGHFGEVWLATDVGLNIDRAVKLIPPDKVPDASNFFREAQTLKAAEHPNVVRVSDTGKFDDGRIYVAMEYLPKGSLEDEASGAYVHLTRAKRLMIDMLRGLEHAHNVGILHRDIKPANVLIGKNNEGKLSDFGLALPIGVDPKATGIKDYLYRLHVPPEVHSGQPYAISGEIYACGVTLYRLINGDSYLPPPTADIAARVVAGEYPDRSSYRDFIPRSVRMIINRAMNVDPTKRYQSAREMRRAVEQLNSEMNWQETKLSNGMRWRCGWDNFTYELVCLKCGDGTWSVELRKGRNKKSLRRITKHCHGGLSKGKAEQVSRRILQDFVSGKN